MSKIVIKTDMESDLDSQLEGTSQSELFDWAIKKERVSQSPGPISNCDWSIAERYSQSIRKPTNKRPCN